MTDTPDREAIDWSVGGLDEARWRQLAEAAHASELQLRFSVLRFGGASASKAAKISGYKGDAAAIRTAGYSAVRSTAVQNLLELASVNAPEEARISDREIDAKIAKLIRSQDATVALKAAEIHAKRQVVRREYEASAPKAEYDPVEGMVGILDGGFFTPFGPLLVILWGWIWDLQASQKEPGRAVFERFLIDLLPHIERDFPDVVRKLNSFARGQALAAHSGRPLKPLEEIIAQARAHIRRPVKGNGAAAPEPQGVSDAA